MKKNLKPKEKFSERKRSGGHKYCIRCQKIITGPEYFFCKLCLYLVSERSYQTEFPVRCEVHL